MKTSDAIRQKVDTLPEPLQREVLDFVEYLAGRHAKEGSEWSEFSLTSALRGMEEESWPEYGDNDIKEKYR